MSKQTTCRVTIVASFFSHKRSTCTGSFVTIYMPNANPPPRSYNLVLDEIIDKYVFTNKELALQSLTF